MNLLQRLRLAFQRSDDLKTQLFAFLASGDAEFATLTGKRLSRDDVRELLQKLIPADIVVRGNCQQPLAVVVSAPHVSFDNWAEFFCNRLARRFRTGWVVARNFRDQDPHTIPVSIGRHLHVNRPTESVRPGGEEDVTKRAQAAHAEYLAALLESTGRTALPIDLLIEIHAHHRTPFLEVATAGVEPELARELEAVYGRVRTSTPLPEIRIEPLHELRLTAEATKQFGSLRSAVARRALHFEVPREARRSDETRQDMCRALFAVTETLLQRSRELS
jgi:hypothetical protein